MPQDLSSRLAQRLGRLHAKQRVGIEDHDEARVFGGRGINFFHIENWYSIHSVIRNTLKLTGLYWRGRRNAPRVRGRPNHLKLSRLPSLFDASTILPISHI